MPPKVGWKNSGWIICHGVRITFGYLLPLSITRLPRKMFGQWVARGAHFLWRIFIITRVLRRRAQTLSSDGFGWAGGALLELFKGFENIKRDTSYWFDLHSRFRYIIKYTQFRFLRNLIFRSRSSTPVGWTSPTRLNAYRPMLIICW